MKHIAKSVTWVGFLTLITALVLVLSACDNPDNSVVEPKTVAPKDTQDIQFWNTQWDEAAQEERADPGYVYYPEDGEAEEYICVPEPSNGQEVMLNEHYGCP